MSEERKHGPNCSDKVDRRKFLGAAAMTAGMMLIKPELVRGTAANSAVRVGLLGCGGRGTEIGRARLNSSHSQISYAVFCLKISRSEANISGRMKPSVGSRNTITLTVIS